MYLIPIIFVIFGIIGVVYFINNLQKQGKREILKTLFKNNEITSDVYKKYIDEL